MKTAIVTLRSASPYGQGRALRSTRNNKETGDDYEQRCWRERMHVNDFGNMVIPGVQFRNSLMWTAKFLGLQIKGRGKSTYTKHFEAGIMVNGEIDTGYKASEIPPYPLFVPATGKTDEGVRVWKNFPMIPKWEGTIEFIILSDAITEDVFKQHIEECGKFGGIGVWRPNRRGMWGRFEVVKIVWK